MSLDGHWVQTT